MTVRSLTIRAAVAAIVAFGLALPVLAAEKVPCERRIPKSALFYFSIRNVEDLSRRFSESTSGRLIMDPSLDAFRGEVSKAIQEHQQEAEKVIGLSLKDLLSIPKGEVALAAITVKGKPSLVGVMDFGEGQELVNTLLEKAAAALEKSAKRTDEEFEGSNIAVYQFPQPEGQAPRPLNGVAWSIKETCLILGSSPECVKSVLRFWEGDQPQSLADNEVFRYIADKCKASEDDTPAVTWYVNTAGLLQTALAQAGPQAAVFALFLPQLGLDKAKAVGGTVDMSSGDFDSVSRTLWYLDEQPRTGLLNLFDFPAAELAPPAWVPANAVSYRTLNWDLEKAYGAVEQVYEMVPGTGKGSFSKLIDELSENENSVNLHIKKDVIDQFTGRIHVLEGAAEGEDKDRGVLFAVSVKDAAAFEKVLGKVTAHPGFPGKRREFQGQTLFEFATPNGTTTGLAVAQQSLLIATDVKLLETVLRGGSDDSLAGSETFQSVAKKFPSEISYIGFQRTDAGLRDLLDLVKSNQLPGAGEISIDFSKLPDFEQIKKYFTAGGAYMTPDDRGLFFVSFTLRE